MDAIPRLARSVALFALLLSPTRGQAAPRPAELDDPSLCLASGFTDDLSPYLQRLDIGASPYGKKSAFPLFMPLFSSHVLGGPAAVADPAVTTAAIFLHGLSAAANSYFCTGMAASRGRSAVVVAPWHGDEQVNSSYWRRTGETAATGLAYSAYWTSSRWLTGGNVSPGNLTDAAQYTTSFDIADQLVRNLTSSGLFPNLKQVSFIGFSAGSQFTSRWVFGSSVGDPALTGSASPSNGVPVRHFISDPGTFLYLDASRPAPECRPLRDSGAGAAPCTTFAEPAPAEVAACATTWNAYKFGIDGGFSNLNAYMARYDTNATLKAEALARFARKDLALIFGDSDACNCNAANYSNSAYCFPAGGSLVCAPDDFGGAGCCDTWPDATDHNAMDAGCEAMVQGSNRLQRGLLYTQHLNRVFPSRAAGRYVAYTVAGMGHNNSGLYASAPFNALAFYTPATPPGSSNQASGALLSAEINGTLGGLTALAAVVVAVGILRLRSRKSAAALEDEEARRPLTSR